MLTNRVATNQPAGQRFLPGISGYAARYASIEPLLVEAGQVYEPHAPPLDLATSRSRLQHSLRGRQIHRIFQDLLPWGAISKV